MTKGTCMATYTCRNILPSLFEIKRNYMYIIIKNPRKISN